MKLIRKHTTSMNLCNLNYIIDCKVLTSIGMHALHERRLTIAHYICEVHGRDWCLTWPWRKGQSTKKYGTQITQSTQPTRHWKEKTCPFQPFVAKLNLWLSNFKSCADCKALLFSIPLLVCITSVT